MIKFFRKIRQNLIMENKTGKPALPAGRYLKYAIGEIVLVVVGILIALQINNWNENRKIENLEISLLIEMQRNLQSDITDMKINKEFHEKGIESAKIILYSFEKNIPPNDSLNKHYGKISLIPKYLTTETAYTSMRREGMRTINNDSLRNAIIYYYEIKSQYLVDFNNSEWDVQFQDSRDISRKYFKEFQVFNDLVPTDYNELSQSQEYNNYLNNRIGWLVVTINLYNSLNARAENLIEFIDQELQSRKEN